MSEITSINNNGVPLVGGVVDLGAYRAGKPQVATSANPAPPQPDPQQQMTPLHLLMSTAQSVSTLWGLLIEKNIITMADFEQARDAAARHPGDEPQTT